MLKQVSQLTHNLGNKAYHFLCDNDSPLNDVKDALFQFLKYVGNIEDQVKAQAEAQKSAADAGAPQSSPPASDPVQEPAPEAPKE